MQTANKKKYSIICNLFITVPESPAALKALVMSTESVLVSWKPPAEPNGEINQYTVYIKPSGDNKDVCILYIY